ncbi:MAG: hypothetical protein K6U80_05640 [Firmicutes bacterium]|nr:hypothetical protein [Bacillota bacterium]
MLKKPLCLMFPVALILAFGVSFSVVFSRQGNSPQDNRISPKSDGQSERGILWQKPVREKGVTIIPGAALTDFGRLELRWIIGDRETRLVTLEAPGAGELPPLERPIFLLVRDNGVTLLFQEWVPLANENKPVTVRDLVSVDTNDLFSVLPGKRVPPEAQISRKIIPIKWGRMYQKNGVQYLPGKLGGPWPSGRRDIYWMKKPGRIAGLFSPEDRGNGVRNMAAPRDSNDDARLFLWLDGMNGATVLFLEDSLETNQGNISYLWPFAVVETTQLLSGFNEVQRGRGPGPASDN